MNRKSKVMCEEVDCIGYCKRKVYELKSLRFPLCLKADKSIKGKYHPRWCPIRKQIGKRW